VSLPSAIGFASFQLVHSVRVSADPGPSLYLVPVVRLPYTPIEDW
jgi:hypothetical protein